MQDVVRKRLVGAAVLIALGIIVPLLLARWLHNPAADGQAMRVYEITPSGSVQLVDADTDNKSALGTDTASDAHQPDNQAPDLPASGAMELAANEQAPAVPEIKPHEQTQSAQSESTQAQPQQDTAATTKQQSDSESASESARVKSEARATQSEPSQSTSKTHSKTSAGGSSKRSVAAGDWVVQVASFGKENNAQALAQELGSDFPTFYAAADVNGETWYRVRIGPLDSEAAADNVASELHAQGHNTLVLQVD